MKSGRQKIWAILIALIMALSFIAAPEAWAKKKHKVMYKYIYYPSSQVYYSPVRQRYYYQNAGVWTYGGSPPAQINLGKGISINLGGSNPYVYHPVVVREHPSVIVVDN
jgi:hypothetical protein